MADTSPPPHTPKGSPWMPMWIVGGTELFGSPEVSFAQALLAQKEWQARRPCCAPLLEGRLGGREEDAWVFPGRI